MSVAWLRERVPGFGALSEAEVSAISDFAFLWSLFEDRILNRDANVSAIKAVVRQWERAGTLDAEGYDDALTYARRQGCTRLVDAATLTGAVVVALGQIAHVAAARSMGLPPASTKFGHGAQAIGPDGRILLSSYHCSRYNQNTGRLNAEMFEAVFEQALRLRP